MATAAMHSIVASAAPRFESLTRAIKQIRALVAEAGYREAPEKEAKAAFIASLRSVLSDDGVAWLDACAIVTDDDARMMPLLGSGGNEGVLDYSGLFLRSLEELLLGDGERSRRMLRAALLLESTQDLLERPGGQFDPGTAGGFNTGPGFESKDLPNNPWVFLLLIEGAIAWASGVASRQQGAGTSYRFAVSPFTVRHRAAGYGSASSSDEAQRVRAEVWVPVWHRAARYAEVARFIDEGRVDVRRRGGARSTRATDSLDFVDAVASLGVDRGVSAFVRYALVKRRGDSYIALPAGALAVHFRREIDLLRQLDAELELADRFLSRFPSDQGPPAQLAGLRRNIDEARLDVAVRGGQDAMTHLVRAIGAFEMALARRDPSKKPQLDRPLGRLGAAWVDACGDTTEVRIAAAVASIAGTASVGPIRQYLAPLDYENPARYAPSARAIAWTGADLADRMSHLLQRRLLDARTWSTSDGQRAGNHPLLLCERRLAVVVEVDQVEQARGRGPARVSVIDHNRQHCRKLLSIGVVANKLRIERVWIEGFFHEGIAASKGNRVIVSNTVVRETAQAIEAGYGMPSVRVEHSLLTDNRVGLRYGDDYDWEVAGKLEVTSSIVLGNREANVRNYVNQLQGPVAEGIAIHCSIVGAPEFEQVNGNTSVPAEG